PRSIRAPRRRPAQPPGSTSCGADPIHLSATTRYRKQALNDHNRRPAIHPQEQHIAAPCRTLAAQAASAHISLMKDVPDEAARVEAVIPPAPRDYQGVNWAGFRTLYLREVRRFWKVG